MFFTWFIVSNLNGPFQVAEISMETVVEGEVKRISKGFQVVLMGFGSVSQIYGNRNAADLNAKGLNTEFFKRLELKQDASLLPLPEVELDGERAKKFEKLVAEYLDDYRLTAKSKTTLPAPRRGGPRG